MGFYGNVIVSDPRVEQQALTLNQAWPKKIASSDNAIVSVDDVVHSSLISTVTIKSKNLLGIDLPVNAVQLTTRLPLKQTIPAGTYYFYAEVASEGLTTDTSLGVGFYGGEEDVTLNTIKTFKVQAATSGFKISGQVSFDFDVSYMTFYSRSSFNEGKNITTTYDNLMLTKSETNNYISYDNYFDYDLILRGNNLLYLKEVEQGVIGKSYLKRNKDNSYTFYKAQGESLPNPYTEQLIWLPKGKYRFSFETFSLPTGESAYNYPYFFIRRCNTEEKIVSDKYGVLMTKTGDLNQYMDFNVTEPSAFIISLYSNATNQFGPVTIHPKFEYLGANEASTEYDLGFESAVLDNIKNQVNEIGAYNKTMSVTAIKHGFEWTGSYPTNASATNAENFMNRLLMYLPSMEQVELELQYPIDINKSIEQLTNAVIAAEGGKV